MADNDAAARWECADRVHQTIAQPLVGHQPEPGEHGGVNGVVARCHKPAYSARMTQEAKARLTAIQDDMALAAKRSGRKAEEIALIAISKTKSADDIRPLIAAGQRAFGENRVQEAQAKWPALIAETPGIALHLVGSLQSNKAEDAVALFDVIHSVDRPSLVAALAKAQEKTGRHPACFIQVNIGEEPQKGGCAIADLPALLTEARAAGLSIVGLMAVPPEGVEAAPYFALLSKLARDHGLARLSMGMSGDFATAIMLGATEVRIGTALFGARS
jgi:pyridoxal phosphate enzyme (YggS family)